jgi:hypothetical protein
VLDGLRPVCAGRRTMNTDKQTVRGERIPACEIHHYSATDGKCVDCGEQFNYGGNAPRVVKFYRGWAIKARPGNVAYIIHREGWQQRHNFKSIESAKAGIDAIVG